MTQYSSLLLIEGRKRGPDFVAKVRTPIGRWRKVGVAFFNSKTESFTVYFENMPEINKIVMFKNK
ncbi:MAG: hypothetical protein NTX79_06330 [Candidatus Micrarchaeota archaeon]|nr:hypothetical protein [Candidatus Micrarchaeota archaeon]